MEKLKIFNGKVSLTRYGLYLVFAVIVLFFCFTNPNFLTFSNLMLILQQMAPFGVAAIGMIFVLILGGIDISVGRVMFISGVVVGEVMMHLPEGLYNSPWLLLIAYAIAIAVGIVFGLINGVLVTKLNIFPFMATLVIGYIARGLGLTIAGLTKYDVSALGVVSNSRIPGHGNNHELCLENDKIRKTDNGYWK